RVSTPGSPTASCRKLSPEGRQRERLSTGRLGPPDPIPLNEPLSVPSPREFQSTGGFRGRKRRAIGPKDAGPKELGSHKLTYDISYMNMTSPWQAPKGGKHPLARGFHVHLAG